MKPTMEILDRIRENSEKNKDEIFTRLYRYMLRPDLYYTAYKNLYANDGSGTKGVNEDTADAFSDMKINAIIQQLANGSYCPHLARRTYIHKKYSTKMRPLGLPTFTDKLVQEVLRMILEAVYEPTFSESSHGFRPNRSCHTALASLKKEFTGVAWFIEGDIKGCFDNIDHHVLVEIVNSKVKDARLIQLIWKFLKAGYMEDWQYHATYSGCPQGGIVSPLLANIYLNELDKFVAKLAKEFYRPKERYRTPAYDLILHQQVKARAQLKTAKGAKKTMLHRRLKELKAELLKTPCTSATDKVIKYIRYADDFIIGVRGDRSDCENIKKELAGFIRNRLKMELSDEKTLITHSSLYARFLGYDVRVRRSQSVKQGGNCTKRTMNKTVELMVPTSDKIMPFLFNKAIIYQTQDGGIKPVARKSLLRCTEFEIVSTYNAELRGICNYYALASNFGDLHYFAYLMESSCLKTLANKHKSTSRKIRNKYKDGRGGWSIPYQTSKGEKRLSFSNFRDCRSVKSVCDCVVNHATLHTRTTTTFEKRLSAEVCELCGKTGVPLEIHHVNKVKNLKGKEHWEIVMIAKKRKTLAVCEDCHHKIHHPGITYPKQ